MFNWLLQLIFPHTHGGWSVEDEVDDPRDYKFAEAFEDDIFGAVLPNRFEHDMIRTPHQSRISCVPCAATFINSKHSHLEGNDVFLSWPMLYKLVRHFPGGTRIRDVLHAAINYGQCSNNLLDEADFNEPWHSESKAQRRDDLTPQMFAEAENFKIRGYFKINHRDRVEMKTAVMKAPVLIGVYTGSSEWRNKPVITDTGARQYGHVIAIYGWDERGWLIADWNRNDPHKVLDYGFPIQTAYIIHDIPDHYTSTIMKAVKSKAGKIYILLPNGTKQHVGTPQQWEEWRLQFNISDLREIDDEALARIPDTSNGFMAIK